MPLRHQTEGLGTDGIQAHFNVGSGIDATGLGASCSFSFRQGGGQSRDRPSHHRGQPDRDDVSQDSSWRDSRHD